MYLDDIYKFVSKKRDNYLSVNISIIMSIFSLSYISYLFIKAINKNKFHFFLIIMFFIILLIIWLIYNLVKEHYIYKANFITTKKEIIFKSIIYKKEIKWNDVINIKIDVLTPVSSYLPYNETRCVILELKDGNIYKILNGGYKNIDDFKEYLKNSFSEKINQ